MARSPKCNFLTSYFYKKFIKKWYKYIFIKVFSRQIYSYGFHIFKLNDLKVIHNLYCQCLTQTLSKTTCFMGMEGVPIIGVYYRFISVV